MINGVFSITGYIDTPLVVMSPRRREWAYGRFRRGVRGHASDGYRFMCRVASVSPVKGVRGLGLVVEPTWVRAIRRAPRCCCYCRCRSV